VKFLFFHQKLRASRDFGFGPMLTEEIIFLRSEFFWTTHKLTKNRHAPLKAKKDLTVWFGYAISRTFCRVISAPQTRINLSLDSLKPCVLAGRFEYNKPYS
jgi:hypothetical protein